jgi:transposase
LVIKATQGLGIYRALPQEPLIVQMTTNALSPVADICRKAGISQATYFNWKKKYEGLQPPEMRRLKQLEDENAKRSGLPALIAPPTRAASAVDREGWFPPRHGLWHGGYLRGSE